MAAAERVACTTTTTGTGNLTLSATGIRDAVNGDCLAPAETLGEERSLSNRLVSYYIVCGNSWATGEGQISADGLTLLRDSREISWNGTALSTSMLSLTGTSTVFIGPDANDISAGSIGISVNLARGAFSA